MNKRKWHLTFWAIPWWLMFGCDKEPAPPVFAVDEELSSFVDAFYIEANKRGLRIDTTNLMVLFGSESEGPICSRCNSSDLTSNLQKIVTLYEENRCWYNSYQLEALIFHEMGHCLLGRLHNNDTLPNGDPRSLMISNSISQYSPCVVQIGRNRCNFVFKREYYVDELFDQDTPIPEWALD